MQTATSRGPIFILGAMGSGTTLLRLILDSHPGIAVPQETGFARAMMAQRWVPFWLFGDRWWGRLGYTDEEFETHLRNFYETMFRHYAEQHGKQRWGEKTPYHVWHVEPILEIFPDAVFTVIMRHPGANVGSLRSRFDYPVHRAVRHWSRVNGKLLLTGADHPDRFVFCRYEDLVLHPEPTLRELLDWLGEPWSDQVLAHHAVHRDRGTPTKVEGRTRSDDPIDQTRVARWTTHIPAADQQTLRRRTAPLGRLLGYDASAPLPVERFNPDPQRWLLTGAEMAARIEPARGEVLRLQHPPQPSPRDRPLNPRRLRVSVQGRRKRLEEPPRPKTARPPGARRSRERRPWTARRVARRLRAALRRLLR